MVTGSPPSRVSPFGHRGINACVPLPRAYRSLPRPSSPLSAQASSTYVRSLDSSQLIQAKHALFRTSDALQKHPFECNRYYASLRFFVHSMSDLQRDLAWVYPRSLPQPLSNSNETSTKPRNKNRERSGCAGRTTKIRDFRPDVRRPVYSSLRKGGDPAAGSPTATLLRLRPSHCARLRRLGPLRVPTPTSGAHSFHGVTGGVYKARERIHRGVADPRLLAIPASCRRVADDNPN